MFSKRFVPIYDLLGTSPLEVFIRLSQGIVDFVDYTFADLSNVGVAWVYQSSFFNLETNNTKFSVNCLRIVSLLSF